MANKTKIIVFVFLVLALVVVISYFRSGSWDPSVVLQAGLIAAILNGMLWTYDHYGWRAPILSNTATSPNIRGTWEFEKPSILGIESLNRYDHLGGGFISIQQSDSHIMVNILWHGDEPSELRVKSPTAVNQGKIAFSGAFVEQPKESVHGFGAFISCASKCPESFVLWYRTDHGITGEIKALNRKNWFADNIAVAKTKAAKEQSIIDDIVFYFRWM